MSHGSPDWGPSAPKTTLYAVHDMAELAARLGSINTFDRRGDVIWMDDFEDNINKWIQGGNGAGTAVALSTLHARNGAKSAELTTGLDSFRTSWIQRYHPPPVWSRVGIEMSFALEDTLEEIWFSIDAHSGEEYAFAGLKYVRADETLYRRYSSGTDYPIATGIDLWGHHDLFHTWKLVIDLVSSKCVRVIINNHEYDISDKPVIHGSSSQTPFAWIEIYTVGEAGSNVKSYIDDVIITQNEP